MRTDLLSGHSLLRCILGALPMLGIQTHYCQSRVSDRDIFKREGKGTRNKEKEKLKEDNGMQG